MSEGEEWVAALAVGEIEKNGVTLARAGGRDYVIYDAPDGLYASLAYCTHQGALLRDGYFDRHLIECPLHQGCFDIRTGEPRGAPATRRLRVVEVRTRGDVVELRVGPSRPRAAPSPPAAAEGEGQEENSADLSTDRE